ncbi:MAG TPA: patatin-like phospholipase family protein [Steroidobacteraceae bacterium]|nr:patatin-like phospholipase family protein [Steroidobacteraceae bacterium]
MLTLQTAARPRTSRRIGLALAGGGPLGAFYELGALQALTECIEGFDPCDLFAYAGVSSGSMLAAGLANGLKPVDIGRITISNDAGFDPAHPALFMKPAFGEYARRLARLPRLALEALVQYARAPLSQGLAEVLAPLSAAMPAGILDSAPFERYLRRLYTSGGRTNDFRRLRRRLFVVATNFNTGVAARFGEPGLDHVPISRAVQASTALPGLYPPVEIDGQTYADGALLRTMHASVVLEAGVDLLFGINPLVPFDASEDTEGAHEIELTRHGLPVVLGQTFRALIRSRMQVGVASYHDRFPRAEIVLLEPDRGDRRMFFANVFRYADRRRLVDHAFDCTRRDLQRRARELAPVLARHGLALDRKALTDPSRSFHGALERQRHADRKVAHNLTAALDRLERLLA